MTKKRKTGGRGKQVKQAGAVFTVALRKLAEGWRIGAWAWAQGRS